MRCTLQHHGAAASSVAQAVTWIPSTTTAVTTASRLVYASHAVINICQSTNITTDAAAVAAAATADVNNDNSHTSTEQVWRVTNTLRTRLREGDPNFVVTALATVAAVPQQQQQQEQQSTSIALVAAFSDGSLSVWVEQEQSPVEPQQQSSMNSAGEISSSSSSFSTTYWKEFVIVQAKAEGDDDKDRVAPLSPPSRSITTVAATWIQQKSPSNKNDDDNFSSRSIVIVVGSSAGASYYECRLLLRPPQQEQEQGQCKEVEMVYARPTLWHATAIKSVSVRYNNTNNNICHNAKEGENDNGDIEDDLLVLLGTAAPRHNKIHVYCRRRTPATAANTVQDNNNNGSAVVLQYAGGLSGHEDWITCMAWQSDSIVGNGSDDENYSQILATGSQDTRIRLWRFTTTTTTNITTAAGSNNNNNNNLLSPSETLPALVPEEEEIDGDGDDDDDEENAMDKQAAEEEEEGEARLELTSSGGTRVTRVTLEALLLGHEEMVTGVSWHPLPREVYGEDMMLLSSSMDRSILLWTASRDDGIWTPLTRVGSAGGILGGSVGSSLLGYLSASLDPLSGRCLVGHAYGGSLHVWRLDDSKLKAAANLSEQSKEEQEASTAEDRASMVHWRAKPCVTGHFGGVVDLTWEAWNGSYLLSVSQDQTCRLWAPVSSAWVELGRPQVHGYDLTAVASMSTPTHPHSLVTGADEKELRVFDAPKSTIRLLEQTIGLPNSPDDAVERVERAYIPSLGLSNKASAAESAEEDKPNEEESADTAKISKVQLPLERDLGAVSLWPEVRKLFGHNTELYCLATTLAARTSKAYAYNPPQVLVASSCKARDVEAAAIRLWNVQEGKCHQVLAGGHKATVATLAFSPCGNYLASSGKDRRLCVWKRQPHDCKFELAWAQESAHKRIIWSVHFCPFQPNILVSGSRDGCIKVWRLENGHDGVLTASTLFSFAPHTLLNGKPDSVTALCLRPTPYNKDGAVAVLAVGLDSGRLELWSIPIIMATSGAQSTAKPELLHVVPESLCHRATVTKLAWKPERDGKGNCRLLASSSMDHGVRILDIQ